MLTCSILLVFFAVLVLLHNSIILISWFTIRGFSIFFPSLNRLHPLSGLWRYFLGSEFLELYYFFDFLTASILNYLYVVIIFRHSFVLLRHAHGVRLRIFFFFFLQHHCLCAFGLRLYWNIFHRRSWQLLTLLHNLGRFIEVLSVQKFFVPIWTRYFWFLWLI